MYTLESTLEYMNANTIRTHEHTLMLMQLSREQRPARQYQRAMRCRMQVYSRFTESARISTNYMRASWRKYAI